MQGELSYDCQACGACCCSQGPTDGAGYIYLDRQEARRIRALGLPVVEAALGDRYLAMAAHEGSGRFVCAGLVGELGIRCACSIYADRPQVCHEVKVGNALCREAREQAGLPI